MRHLLLPKGAPPYLLSHIFSSERLGHLLYLVVWILGFAVVNVIIGSLIIVLKR